MVALYLSVRDFSLGGSLHPTTLGLQYLSIAVLVIGVLVLHSDRFPLTNMILCLLIGSALSYIWFPTSASSSNIVKFGLGPQIAAVVLFVVARGSRQGLYLLSCAVLSMIFTAFAFRSMSGIVLVAGALTTWKLGRAHSKPKPVRTRGQQGLGIAIALVATVAVVAWAYPALARGGLLGKAQAERVEGRGHSAIDLLLSSRPETIIAFEVIKTSPVLGLGASPADHIGKSVLNDAISRVHDLAPSVSTGLVRDRLTGEINVHSLLFYGWITAGLLGLAFWLIVAACSISSIIRPLRFPATDALATFIGLWTLWDVFFSPWSVHISTSIAAAVLLAFSGGSRRESEIDEDSVLSSQS